MTHMDETAEDTRGEEARAAVQRSLDWQDNSTPESDE